MNLCTLAQYEFLNINTFNIPTGAIIVGILLWIGTIVYIARTKTDDPLDRIVWLIIVLTLNLAGSLLYLFFRPKKTQENNVALTAEEDIIAKANSGKLKKF